MRGQLIDVGRLEPGDPRVGGYAEGRDADRWPRPGEELFVRASGIADVPPSATTASIRAIALEPWKFDGQKVTVTGNFRGRNLFGDLPGRRARAATTSSCAAPRARSGSRVCGRAAADSTSTSIAGSTRIDGSRSPGTIVSERGLVSIDATRLTLAKAPQASDAPAESAAPPVPLEPVQVVFSSPTDGETDVAVTGAIRIQFSRGLNEPSLARRLRVSYVGVAAADAGLPFQATYDAANRAIVLRMAQAVRSVSNREGRDPRRNERVRRRACHAVDDHVLCRWIVRSKQGRLT